MEFIRWDTLAEAAQRFRSVSCKFGEQYRFGGRHVVREFVFEDNVHWIARVNLPEISAGIGENYIPKPISSSWTPQAAAAMQSEIDTMSFLRENTDIPVPRVLYWDTSATNSVGAPYMFMECIKGNSVMDMPAGYEIPGQYQEKYLNAEASIVVMITLNNRANRLGRAMEH